MDVIFDLLAGLIQLATGFLMVSYVILAIVIMLTPIAMIAAAIFCCG